MKNLKYILFACLIIGMFTQCDEKEDFSLPGNLPADPAFTIEPFENDLNKFWVEDLSEGNLARVWNFGMDAMPQSSTLRRDSVFFSKKGTYTIRLNIVAEDGSGTASSQQTVTVAEDSELCTGPFALLTENCTSKCWRLSNEEASLSLGPAPLSAGWFASGGDLVETQLDDLWCFNADNLALDYQNNGGTFSACQGYVDDPNFPIPSQILWTLTPGIGFDGADRIVINTDDIYMGTEDSGPYYDIISITETELVLLSPHTPCDGSTSEGWWTYTYIKE